MKAQILKIAGVKTEAEFYKKFPTEEAFMKKHGKELKKAQTGAWIPGVGFSSDVQAIDKAITKKKNKETALGLLTNQAGSIVGLSQTIADKYGKQSKQLDQYGDIAKLVNKAAASAPTPQRQKYVRPEDQVSQPINPLGVQGFGYFQDGGEIQNTYAPNTLYTDLGYEPLNDSNPKQYQNGGLAANANQYMSAAGSLGGGIGSLLGGGDFEQTEEGQLGSTILGAAGTAIGGPIGGLIGAGIGSLAGGFFGAKKNKERKEKKQNFQNAVASATGIANIQNMNQGSAFVRNGGDIPSYENGGYMNPEYNPQVIAKFGDYSMDQLLAPPHDADMLRAGGHLKEYTPPSARAMYTGRDLPYQMEDGGQMAMGGDLQVHRGKAETMSYNPFLPSGGETVMFRGPSHDNGGMPISFGENGVEVEGGEPAIQMQDGGEEGNLVVYGNMVIPDYGVEELGDPKAKGKKFKHYVADLSKTEAKQNKLIDKTSDMISMVDDNDPFDQLKLNTGKANLMGATMKLKDIADKKITAASVQNAILDTAEEFGLESDALAKGKIKYAKANDPYAEFGTKLSKAKYGKDTKKYDPEFENFINQAMQLEQANSLQANNYRGGGSYFGTNDKTGKIKTIEQAKEHYYKNYWPMVKDLPAGLRTRALQMAINTGDPYGELLVAGKEMTVEERRKLIDEAKKLGVEGLEKNKFIQSGRFRDNKEKIAKVVESYKKDPEAFLANLDAEQNRYYDSLVQANKYPDSFRNFYTQYTDLAKNAAKGFIPSNQSAATQAAPTSVATPAAKTTSAPVRNNYSVGIGSPLEGSVSLSPIAETQPGAYIPNLKDQIINAKIAQMEEGNKMLDDVRVVAPKINPLAYRPAEGSFDPTEGYELVSQNEDRVGQFPITDFQPTIKSEPVSFPTKSKGKEEEKKQNKSNWWETGTQLANSLIPYMRPSNQMELSPAQLTGEMFALSDNTLDPVYAQTFQPDYTQPVSVSYQDQLNANQADFNALQRQFGYSPEAMSVLAGQKYGANSKVLAEQFRANQAEQQRARETNRETANAAKLQNMGIFQNQADKMAQTKSIMKQQKIAALNSINDKFLKNQLENRQLGIAENTYNYRYTPKGVAYNINPLAQFNVGGAGSASRTSGGDLEEGKDFSYNKAGKIIGIHSTGKDDKKNGGIVKAIKNL